MANYKQESGLSIYLCICINAPEGCQLSIYLFPTNRFIGAERPFELRVMSNHPRGAVLQHMPIGDASYPSRRR